MSAAIPALAGTAAFNKTGSMNTARIGHSATLLANGRVLVAGGWNGSSITPTYLASAELYDPATGKWTRTGSMTVARAGHSAVLLKNGEVLVAGGGNGAVARLTSAELYNPATGTWTATGSMTTVRGVDLIVLPSGEVLAAGGDNNVPSTAELYNPVSGTWAATGSLTAGGFGGSAVLLQNGLALAVGNNVADLYNPPAGTWSSTTPPISGSAGYIALLPSGQVWFNGSLYDPATAQWTFAGGPAPCKACAATMLAKGTVLAAGGVVSVAGNPYPTEETVKSAKLWDLAVGEQLGCLCLSWAKTGSLTTSSRAGESMVLLSNGQALVSGGFTITNSGSSVVLASAELYTP